MKKLILTIAIVLGFSLTTFADFGGGGGGLFGRGAGGNDNSTTIMGDRGPFADDEAKPGLPGHGETTNQDAPLTGSIAVLMGLGAAYLVGKKRKED